MEKISIKIDVSKIDKSRITKRTYQNKSGETVTVNEIALDIVPLKETKLLKDGDTYQLWKTHFVAIPQTKEEREQKVKSRIIGDGTIFKNKETPPVELPADVDPLDIPF